MGRQSKREQTIQAVGVYIKKAEQQSPDQYPLQVKAVAERIGCSRTLLYKYDLAEIIQAANRRQREHFGLTGKNGLRRGLAEVVAKLRSDLALAHERNKALVARLNMVEANAARLGIDPEELYQEIVKPDRSQSHAITGRKSRG